MLLKLDNEKYGDYIREERRKAKLTQSVVAGKAGFTVQFLSNAERGQCSLPLKSLRKILRLYKTNPKEIISLMLEDYEEALTKALIPKKPDKK